VTAFTHHIAGEGKSSGAVRSPRQPVVPVQPPADLGLIGTPRQQKPSFTWGITLS